MTRSSLVVQLRLDKSRADDPRWGLDDFITASQMSKCVGAGPEPAPGPAPQPVKCLGGPWHSGSAA